MSMVTRKKVVIAWKIYVHLPWASDPAIGTEFLAHYVFDVYDLSTLK